MKCWDDFFRVLRPELLPSIYRFKVKLAGLDTAQNASM